MVTRFKTSSGRPVRPRSFSRAALSAVAALAVVVSAVAPASAGAPTAGASTGTGSAATAAASTGTNPAPLVVPAIGTWRGGSGDYTLPKVVTVRVAATDRASLATLRSTFAPELASTSGRQVVVTPGTNGARSGDIVAVVDPARHDLGAEGYDLDIGDSVRLTAGTDAGLFYGTRTLLQLAHQGASFPQGEALDVPRYAERGVGVCACYIHFSMAFFQRLILDASYLKLNQLQLELKVKSSTHPEVNTWGYYTVAEIKSIQALASKYHITVIPEVNSPGHIDPWISGDPQLQLVNAAGVAQPSRLDITKPAAFTFLTSIIDDYFKVFNTPYWHMGADEYMLGSDYANYPQLAAYAKRKFGPNAVPQDAFVDFVNRIDAYVRSKGKTLRMWNDGVVSAATVPLRSDIVIEHWLGSGVSPQDLMAQGHQVENAAYSLYIVRGGFKMNTASLYAQCFDPTFFEGQRVAANPLLTGAKIMVWPDNQSAETENEVAASMVDPLRYVAQITWGAPQPDASYQGFTARSAAVGHAPGWTDDTRLPVAAGNYQLSSGKKGLTVTGNTVGVSRTPSTFTLTGTADGYYTVRAPDGRCAVVATDPGAAAPLRPGTEVTLVTCAAGARAQRWQLVRKLGRGKYTLVNALSELGLVASGSSAVSQQIPDVHRATVWTLLPR